MEPIRDIHTVSKGDVLHHPALGFAIVEEVEDDVGSVRLRWERPGENHPKRASAGALSKGYRLCPQNGFLAKSVLYPDEIKRLTVAEPVSALRLLLRDLNEPQRRRDIREWLMGRGLMSENAFDRWWDNLRTLTRHDPAFRWDQQAVFLGADIDMGRPLGAKEDELDEDEPTPSVDELVASFQRLEQEQQEELLAQLPQQGRQRLLESALDQGDKALLVRLLAYPLEIALDRVEQVRTLGLQGEPVLLARLVTLEDDETLASVATAAKDEEGRKLVTQVLETMGRRERVRAVLNLMESLLERGPDATACRFLLQALPEGAIHDLEREVPAPPSQTPFQIVNHLLHLWPRATTWIREHSLEETIDAEVDESGPLLRHQPALPRTRVLPLHIALARELAERHAKGMLGGLPGARLKPGGQVTLGPPEESEAQRDVRDSFQLMLELVVGSLPRGQTIPGYEILSHLALLSDDLPPDWLGLVSRGLAIGRFQRPRSAVALWHGLERAYASGRVREQCPARDEANWEVGHDTHIGALKSRLGQVNQDALFWTIDDVGVKKNGIETSVSTGLIVVADGISVSTAGTGDLASAILVQVVGSLWEQQKDDLADASTDEIQGFLDSALAAANHAICEGSLRLSRGDLTRHIPMGTTVVAAVLVGNTAHLASLGDSRAFLVTQSGVALLTGDQNVRSEWFQGWQQGKPSDLIGEGHALVRYAGHFSDLGQSLPCPIEHRTLKVLPGETLVLCTDGFTDYASDNPGEIAAMIEDAAALPDLGRACRSLVDKANEGGGGDNVTIIMCRLHD